MAKRKAKSRKKEQRKTPPINKLDAIKNQLKKPTFLTELTELTGWQPHSVRAALTRLRQRGHTIERAQSKSAPSQYRLLASK